MAPLDLKRNQARGEKLELNDQQREDQQLLNRETRRLKRVKSPLADAETTKCDEEAVGHCTAPTVTLEGQTG